MSRPTDLQVDIRNERSKAVIEGKTSVPFKTIVQLILQRKVLTLFKNWGDEPVIINSDLLTNLASAPQDSQENRAQLVLVTLGTGILIGVFALAVFQIALLPWNIHLAQKELLIIAGGLVSLALLVAILSRVQRKNRSQKIADAMERIANMLSK